MDSINNIGQHLSIQSLSPEASANYNKIQPMSPEGSVNYNNLFSLPYQDEYNAGGSLNMNIHVLF